MEPAHTNGASASSSPEVYGGKWISLFISPTLDSLIVEHGSAYRLLSWIARRANWKNGIPDNRLKEGQCFVKGWEEAGLTQQEWRTAKDVLGPARLNLVTAEGIKSGKCGKGTLFTLTSTTVFALNSKVFSGSAKGGSTPRNDQVGSPPPSPNDQPTPPEQAEATISAAQSQPMLTGQSRVSAVITNDQQSITENVQPTQGPTINPSNRNHHPTIVENQKPAPEARKQRAKPPSVATLPDLDVPDLERSDPSKLRNSKGKPNSKLSAEDFIREKAAGIRFHADELLLVPARVEDRWVTYAWLKALWEKLDDRMGDKGNRGNWFESYIGQWMARAHEFPGKFRMVWADTLDAHKREVIEVSLGAHANDYWLRLEKGKQAA